VDNIGLKVRLGTFQSSIGMSCLGFNTRRPGYLLENVRFGSSSNINVSKACMCCSGLGLPYQSDVGTQPPILFSRKYSSLSAFKSQYCVRLAELVRLQDKLEIRQEMDTHAAKWQSRKMLAHDVRINAQDFALFYEKVSLPFIAISEHHSTDGKFTLWSLSSNDLMLF
jgi:hypothetical protein